MSKTILANVDGFTPLIDSVAKEVGVMTAAVFGRVWRYCQMEDGVCTASLHTIADTLGIDHTTVLRHIGKLVQTGYLEDRTPGLRNAPHTYADTGKAGLSISLTGANRTTSSETGAENTTTGAENTTTGAKRKLKKDSKTAEETPSAARKPDLLDGMLKYGLPSAQIKAALREHFPFNVNWDRKSNAQWMEWAVNEAKITPEQIAQAAKTWRSDRRFNWQHPTLDLLYRNWPALLGQKVGESEKSRIEDDGELPDFTKQLLAEMEDEDVD